MKLLPVWISQSWNGINNSLPLLSPLVDFLIRCWLGYIFFTSAWLKLSHWSATVFLFTYEYHVPLLPPLVAAVLASAVELIAPIFLVLGLGQRLPAVILFIFNIVAVISYPFLLTPSGAEGLEDHFYWGILLVVTMVHEPGKLTLDYWIRRLCTK